MEKINNPHTGDHSFNVNVATILKSVTKATLLKDLYGWCILNQKRKHNIIEEYVFTFNSTSALHKLFPYIPQSTISNHLNKLEKEGWLWSTKKFNKTAYDRTKWYTVFLSRYELATQGYLVGEDMVEEWKQKVFDTFKNPISQNKKSISQNGQSSDKNGQSSNKHGQSSDQSKQTIPTHTQLVNNSYHEGTHPQKNKLCNVLNGSVEKPNHSSFFEKEKSCDKKEKATTNHTLHTNQLNALQTIKDLKQDKGRLQMLALNCGGWNEEEFGEMGVELDKFHAFYCGNGNYITKTESFINRKLPAWLSRAKHEFKGRNNPKHTIPTQPQNHHQVKALAKKSIGGGYDEEGAW